MTYAQVKCVLQGIREVRRMEFSQQQTLLAGLFGGTRRPLRTP